VSDLKGLVARMVGPERAEVVFDAYAAQHGVELHDELQANEHLVALSSASSPARWCGLRTRHGLLDHRGEP